MEKNQRKSSNKKKLFAKSPGKFVVLDNGKSCWNYKEWKKNNTKIIRKENMANFLKHFLLLQNNC